MTKKHLLIWTILSSSLNLLAIAPVNIFEIDYTKRSPRLNESCNWQFDFNSADMLSAKGHNLLGASVNILQIWQPDQASLPMVRGFESTSLIGKLASKLNTANDDGVRGHVTPTAKFTGQRIIFTLRRQIISPQFSINLALPIFRLKLAQVNWEDQTKNFSFNDQLVLANLTNDLNNLTQTLGNGLNINAPWQKTGCGDIQIIMDWAKNFHQMKPILKSVRLGASGGLSLPTGVRRNEDQLMSLPFGNDGALGIVFGGQIELQWWQNLRGGISSNFLEQLGATRNRRIKTDSNQTDLLLLSKTKTYKSAGFTQQHILYLETFKIAEYFSFKAAYNYLKHNSDKLKIFDESYSSEIANTALSLQDWTQHSVILSARYTGRCTAEMYYQYPFNGKGTIQARILGGSLSWNF